MARCFVYIPGFNVPSPMATEAYVLARLVRARQERRKVLIDMLAVLGVRLN